MEKERERNIDVREKYRLVVLKGVPTREQTCNPDMYPHREANQQPFALWADAQPSHTSQGSTDLV